MRTRRRPTHAGRRRRRWQVLLAAAAAMGAIAAAAAPLCGFLPTAAVLLPSHARWLLHQRGGSDASSAGAASTSSADAPALLLPVPGFSTEAEVLESERGLAWSTLLLQSFHRTVGRPLLSGLDGLDERAQTKALFEAPCVVVSHQTQADPVLCYGNKRALALWDMDLPTLTATPSRLTAEPVERAERQRLLDAVAARGFIDDYKGVRISSAGKRFMIEQCIVWEVVDAQGVRRGQAATFENITPL